MLGRGAQRHVGTARERTLHVSLGQVVALGEALRQIGDPHRSPALRLFPRPDRQVEQHEVGRRLVLGLRGGHLLRRRPLQLVAEPLGEGPRERPHPRFHVVELLLEVGHRDADDGGLFERPYAGRSAGAGQDSGLAEDVTAAQLGVEELLAVLRLRVDLAAPAHEHVGRVGRLALANDHLPGRDGDHGVVAAAADEADEVGL